MYNKILINKNILTSIFLLFFFFIKFQIYENDNLPYLLCDLCIVQLNVAYNFKQKSIETETKYRQMIIEKGLNYREPNPLQQNKTTNIISPTSTSSHVTEIAQNNVLQHRPIFIKTEPIECDNSSNYSMDTKNDFQNNSPIIAIVPNVEPNSLENKKSDSKFLNDFMNLNSEEENKHTVVNPLNSKNKAKKIITRKAKTEEKKSRGITKKIISGKSFRKSRIEINYSEKKGIKPKVTIITKEQKNLEKNLKDAKKSAV